jgi:capsular exopolysaccharide synthesis family protein
VSNLVSNSVLEEVRRLYDDRQSGTLTTKNSNGVRVEIVFLEGFIEAASSNLNSHRLGDYLVRESRVSAHDLQGLEPSARRERLLFGESVVRKGLLTPVEVGTAVRCQVIELLQYAFKNAFVVEAFKSNLSSYFCAARISFPHLLLALCRSNSPPLETKTDIRITLFDGIEFSLFPWNPQELCVLNELQCPSTFRTLLKTTALRESNLRGILGVLDGLGIVQIEDLSNPVERVSEENALVRPLEFPVERLTPVVTNAMLNERLEVAHNELSFTSEQFKNLKVQVSSAQNGTSLKVLTISSPDPEDGKSLIAANLAFSFAMEPERRILIVDCDLRSPSQQEYLGVPSEPGLLQCLADGQLDPNCYIRRVRNLYVLTAGGVARNPVEILSMDKMKRLVERFRREFDVLILDAPPYGPVADARLVTSLGDALIIVIRRGKTSSSSSDRAFRTIDRNKLLGVVFNDVQPMLFHTYYDRDYYQKLNSRADNLPESSKKYLQS